MSNQELTMLRSSLQEVLCQKCVLKCASVCNFIKKETGTGVFL